MREPDCLAWQVSPLPLGGSVALANYDDALDRIGESWLFLFASIRCMPSMRDYNTPKACNNIG